MPIVGKPCIDARLPENMDLPTLVLENMKQFSDKPFLTDGLLDVTCTFKEVHDAAVSIAVYLRKLGVAEGCYVAFITDNTMEAFMFTIGVWLAGGCVCPMNPHLLPGEIRQLLLTSTANIVYCENSKLKTLEEAIAPLENKFTIITDGTHNSYNVVSQLLNEDISTFSVQSYIPDEHIMYVIFTSGTTGVSKGVKLTSAAAIINGCRVYVESGPIFLTTPFFWISNPTSFVSALIDGSQCIFPRVKLLPGSNEPDCHHLLRCIEKYKPKKWMSSPSSVLDLVYLKDIQEYDLSSLTHFSVGGSAVLPSQKKLICEKLFKRNILQERYGSTEVGFLTKQWLTSPPDFDDKKSASIGPCCPGVELKIVDVNTGEELGPNQEGEIFVRGEGVMKGYINKDMPKIYTKDDWYGLGDLGWYDDDEWIYVKGRLKEIIKYRGFPMAPVDLEKIIIQYPGVLDVCVVGKPHPTYGELPLAFVVKKPNSELNESQLIEYVNGRVSDEKKLRGGVIFKDEIPKSGAGKILRRKLLEEFE